MDPEEAFKRLGALVEAYLNLRFEVLDREKPLDLLPTLARSKNPRVAALANEIQVQVDWMRTWFPGFSPTQLVHVADLVTRALHRRANKDPEDQLVRIVATDVGTIRARYLIDDLEKNGFDRRTRARGKRSSPREIVNRGRKILQRATGKLDGPEENPPHPVRQGRRQRAR